MRVCISPDEQLVKHCKCCDILRAMVRERASSITVVERARPDVLGAAMRVYTTSRKSSYLGHVARVVGAYQPLRLYYMSISIRSLCEGGAEQC